jgi:hypothetical protein
MCEKMLATFAITQKELEAWNPGMKCMPGQPVPKATLVCVKGGLASPLLLSPLMLQHLTGHRSTCRHLQHPAAAVLAQQQPCFMLGRCFCAWQHQQISH